MDERIEVDADELARRGTVLADVHDGLSGQQATFEQTTVHIGHAFGELDVCDAAAAEYTAMSSATTKLLTRLRASGQRHVDALLEGTRAYRSTADSVLSSARRFGDTVHDL